MKVSYVLEAKKAKMLAKVTEVVHLFVKSMASPNWPVLSHGVWDVDKETSPESTLKSLIMRNGFKISFYEAIDQLDPLSPFSKYILYNVVCNLSKQNIIYLPLFLKYV